MTPNQITTVPEGEQRRCTGVRQRIEEGHEIQNTGCNIETLVNKTVEGFITHVCLKIASHSLRLLLCS